MDQYQGAVAQESELDWNSSISKESDFIVLPDGDYDFVVESYGRERYNGGDNFPACNVAVLNVRVNTNLSEKGFVVVKHRLMLHTKTEWALSQFFTAIGQKKKGEALLMNWNSVPGSKGRLKLGHKTYKDNEYNEIKKFYSKEDSQSQQTSTFQPGKF